MIFDQEIETLSRGEMEKLQLERLQRIVSRVYERVPFYKSKFDELGLKPENIRSLSDLAFLPFTTKKDLRDNYPFGLFAAELKDVVRIHASSGTSGKPTVVGYTANDIEVWATVVARSIAAAGGEPGQILHNAYGYGLFTGGLGLHYGGEKLKMTIVPVSGGNTSRQVTLIQEFKPTVLCSTPSYALRIAEVMEEMNIDPRQNSLKYGIFGAETWSEEMRKTLEEKLDIKAMDIYGLSEIIGPGVAIECKEAQNGLHIHEDHFLPEIIDPNTLEPLGEGEEGELVITSLTKEAIPLIRYRTGDITSLTREKCICGRTTVRMNRVKGRYDDMLIIRGVNVFPSEIERCLLKVKELAPHYQVHISKNGPLDFVQIYTELDEHIYRQIEGDLEHDFVRQLKAKVEKMIKEECLVTISVKIEPPRTIPRSEGKAVRIVDERKKQSVTA